MNTRGSTLIYHLSRNAGQRGLPFAPGRTFAQFPCPGFQPMTQALCRFSRVTLSDQRNMKLGIF